MAIQNRNKVYYPKSHVVTSLFTDGKQFMLESGIEYKGFYHRYIDGTIFTQAEWDRRNSKRLITYVDQFAQPQTIVYDSLVFTNKNYTAPQQSYNVPIAAHFKAGKFARYFLTRRNSNTPTDLIEIDERQFKLWSTPNVGIDENLYTAISMNWKLTGPLHDEKIDAMVVNFGVYDTNKRMVLLTNKRFPGLQNFLTNFTELTIYSPFISKEIKKVFGAIT